MNKELVAFLLLFVILSLKIMLLAFVFIGGEGFYPQGTDADFYHRFALGEYSFAPNIWPKILFYLESVGLYSRQVIGALLALISYCIIPFMVFSAITPSKVPLKHTSDGKFYKILFISWVFLYPTVLYFSFDVFRDILMLLLFCAVVLLVKRFYEIRGGEKIIIFSVSLLFILILSNLRLYLGISIIISILIVMIIYTPFKNRRINVKKMSLLYMTAILCLNYTGILTPLFEYRTGFEGQGGSTMGIDLINSSILSFLPLFCLSYIYQFFGLYFTNAGSFVLFFFETIPIIFFIIVISRNKSHIDKFALFLVVFVVVYNSFWVIGNDNLGTAVRLRVFSYISLGIVSLYLYLKRGGE